MSGTEQINRLEIEPVSFADFSADPATYEVGGEAVAITDYFGSGAQTIGGPYNPAKHTSEGVVNPDGENYSPALKPAVFGGLGSGFTGVVDVTVPAGSIAGMAAADAPGLVPFLSFDVRTNDEIITGERTTAADNQATLEIPEDLSEGRHRFSFTYISGKMAISVDGEPAVVDDVTPETWATQFDEMCLTVGQGSIVHHLALYEPQEDTALPVLSAL